MRPDPRRHGCGEISAWSSMASDGAVVPQRHRLSVEDLEVVPDSPLPGRPITPAERFVLVALWGPHVAALIDTRRLQVRRGHACWYYRPAGWRSLSPADQTSLVVDMLNGDPAGAVA